MIGSLGVVREHAGTGADESGRIGDLLRRSALRIEGRLEGLTAKRVPGKNEGHPEVA